MYRFAFALALVLSTVAVRGTDAAEKAPGNLQGNWLFVIGDEAARLDPQLGFYPYFEITANKVIMHKLLWKNDRIDGDERGIENIYKLDAAKKPKEIDFIQEGKVRRGIYRLEGERLTICFPREIDGPRPASFKDKEVTVSPLVRVKGDVGKLINDYIDRWDRLPWEEIHLPRLDKPPPAIPGDKNRLSFAIDKNGKVRVEGEKEPLASDKEVLAYFKKEFARRRDQAEPARSSVEIFVDRNAEVLHVYRAAGLCRGQGFRRLFVRVFRNRSHFLKSIHGHVELLLPDWRRPGQFSELELFARTYHDGINNGELWWPVELSGRKHGKTSIREVELLPQKLKEYRPDVQSDAVLVMGENGLKIGPIIELMERCRAGGFNPVLGPSPDFEKEKPRLPAPDPAAQARAAAEIKKLYQPLEARLKPAALAAYYLRVERFCTEPPANCALLEQAARSLARADLLIESMQVFDRLQNEYSVDVWKQKLNLLKSCPVSEAVVDAAEQQASKACLLDRNVLAAQFLAVAENAARRLNNAELIAYVDQRRELLKIPRSEKVDTPTPLPRETPKDPPKSTTPRPPTTARAKGEERKPMSPPEPTEEPGSEAVWYILGGSAAVILLTAALIWRMRQSDAATRQRLAQTRGNTFTLEPGEEESPPSAESPPAESPPPE